MTRWRWRSGPGLAVRGEVDLATAPALEDALADAIRESDGALVVDLSGVEFLDSSGLKVLLRARALLGTRGPRAGRRLPARPRAPGVRVCGVPERVRALRVP